MTTRKRPRVGVSACLLGHEVRYDGGHKRNRRIVGTLGRLFEWVPVCPEVELGLGVPRETLRLEGSSHRTRLVFSDSRLDITRRMNAWSRRRVRRLETLNLCGYILKSRSPSCGPGAVPLHADRAGDAPTPNGVGLFARALTDRLPLLPVEDEERLRDPQCLDRFVERVYRYRAQRHARPTGRGRRAGRSAS